ncbi:MAG: hypothetical protein CRN43_08290 [Candidatus Nephrothrix sp. EaCA]|nr:MAG: hypothetical protein CRN43_08290 [Candidatus Nephrothrix sp. EaCA]
MNNRLGESKLNVRKQSARRGRTAISEARLAPAETVTRKNNAPLLQAIHLHQLNNLLRIKF